MKECQLDLSDQDLRALFDYFDADSNGSVAYEELLEGVREPLNETRRTIVDHVFQFMANKRDRLPIAEMCEYFDPSGHPYAQTGSKTPSDVLQDFIRSFGPVVKAEDFVGYYDNIGATVPEDYVFESMMRNGKYGELMFVFFFHSSILPSFNPCILPFFHSSILPSSLILSYPSLTTLSIHDHYTTVWPSTMVDGYDATASEDFTQLAPPPQNTYSTYSTYSTTQARAPPTRPSSASATVRGSGRSAVAGSSLRRFNEQSGALSDLRLADLESRREVQRKKNAGDVAGKTLLEVLHVQLLSRGTSGIIDLQRRFVQMDTDNSTSLDGAEFKEAMIALQIPFSGNQLDMLVECTTYFQTPGNRNAPGELELHCGF